ncbi:S8 family serine peptidase [Paraclostridium sordellii]|uniref:S8 family serine peptidase n=1 Tax=Paraclostridium sordellii TaxID=1505 RepID=UPI0005412B85|nr:S8 family serine peptidase [Paeniclostridium sordellii]CEK39959.1 putative peptidase, S8 or S52 family [[Clostridium] sordellii] [Paeniclostridium sordellii]
MKKIKIAVIDTGVDIHDDEIKDNIIFDRNLQVDDFETKYKNIEDLNSHGTFCAKTILYTCKDVLIYPIKIFDEYGKTSSSYLIRVLEKILNTDIDIINISASSINCPVEKELEIICEKLYNQGKIIISSHHNKKINENSTPTKFNTVIGVKGINEIYKDTEYIYNPNDEIQIYGNSKDRLLKFKDTVTHFGKNSRAAAVFSGLIAKMIIENGYKTNNIEEVINKNSLNIKEISYSPRLQNVDFDSNRNEVAQKLVTLINDEFAVRKIDLDFLKEYSLLNNFSDIGIHNVYEFLIKINEEFDIDIDYRDIFIYELDYLRDIVEIIYEKLLNKSN